MVKRSRCTPGVRRLPVDTRHPSRSMPASRAGGRGSRADVRSSTTVITCVARGRPLRRGRSDRRDDRRHPAAPPGHHRRGPDLGLQGVMPLPRPDHGRRPDVLNHNIETVARLQRACGRLRATRAAWRCSDVPSRQALSPSRPHGGAGEHRGRGAGHAGRPRGRRRRHRHHRALTCGPRSPFASDAVVVTRGVRTASPSSAVSEGLAHVEASPLTRSSYHARSAAGRPGRCPRRRTDAQRPRSPSGSLTKSVRAAQPRCATCCVQALPSQ